MVPALLQTFWLTNHLRIIKRGWKQPLFFVKTTDLFGGFACCLLFAVWVIFARKRFFDGRIPEGVINKIKETAESGFFYLLLVRHIT